MRKLCFVDVETTGLDAYKHAIIEIAVIREDGKSFAARVQPSENDLRNADPVALEINKYTEKEWAGSISPRVAAKQAADIMQGCVIVGHNVHFDISFLKELFEAQGVQCWFVPRLVDTQVLSFEHLHFLRSHSLDNLRVFFGWSLDGAHSALIDVLDTQKLFYKLRRASVLSRLWWRFLYKLRSWCLPRK